MALTCAYPRAALWGSLIVLPAMPPPIFTAGILVAHGHPTLSFAPQSHDP
jgi:hypothetical protein